MPREMDLHSSAWDWHVLGLSSPSLSEDVLGFSSRFTQPLFTGIEEQLNASHEKPDVFADWMDEKIDLSILDGLEGQPGILDDLDVMVGDSAALLDNLMDWSSEFLQSDVINIKKGESLEQDMLQIAGVSPPVSPGGNVPDISFDVLPESKQESLYRQTSDVSRSPVSTFVPGTEQKSNDDFNPLDYLKVEYDGVELKCSVPSSPPMTPVSFVSNDNEYIESCSPVNTELESSVSFTPPVTPKSFVPTVELNTMKAETSVSVEMPHLYSSFVLDSQFSCKNSDTESHEMSDVSMKEDNSGNTSLLKFKVDTKSDAQAKKPRSRKKTVSTSDSPVPVEVRRKERKRVQNKDAATRYREKKRKESKAVTDEELGLEKRNKELHNTVDKLSSEISYLKGLLKEAKLRAQARQMSSNVASSITV